MNRIYWLWKVEIIFFVITGIITFNPPAAISFTKGDIDDNGVIDLKEAIYALQIVSGRTHEWRTLDRVKARGQLKVGIRDSSMTGFFVDRGDTPPVGLEADIARALAVAIFPNVAVADIDEKLQFIKATSSSRFTDLQEKKFDVLIRVSTFTLSRDRNSDRGPNLHFCPAYFYGGQGLMANSALSLSDMDGKRIAVSEDYESQYNLDKFMQAQGYTYAKINYPSLNSPEMFADYASGNVDAVSSDKVVLLDFKSEFASPGSHRIFDVTMSRDLLCPVVLYGDDQWTDLVSWVVYSLFEAEELGLNSTNIDAPPNLDNPAVERFLGMEGTLGEDLGLTNTWAREIIRKVGNYQEIYERNIGSENMARGPNRLYTKGGILYAPLMR